MTRRFIVEADGGSRGNPGPAGYGAVVRDATDGLIIAEAAAGIGRATNNVAEYRGLIAGLEAAAAVDPGAAIDVRMDSKLVIEQMAGRWKVKHPDMKPLALEAQRLARAFPAITWEWIPREKNKAADKLANEAMDAQAEGRTWQPGAGVEAPAPEVVTAAPIPRLAGWTPATLSPTTTLVVRHGQTPHSAEKRFSGVNDLALTQLGLAQANAVAARLGSRPAHDIEVIVASPLRRAQQTAAAIAATTGAEIVTDERLQETDFGEWEGLTFAEARERDGDHVTRWLSSMDVAPPGGESVADTMARVTDARNDVLERYGEQTVVLVSHVTPIKCITMLAGDLPLSALLRVQIDLCSLTTLDWYADGPAVLRGVNDVGHLSHLTP
ncbi:MAG TPA: bifunctional RNase H/acid phosphatase [Mycobacteriales bacterium]|nr:bifunctional RNase H/acid phosphatase [Mycobacteriales bacterium]